ncbi:uncharacterized protein BDZ99DRAFT_243196 [Mytilinidion resinicola]|uniref:MADS-box domain-containing protein n=1 Tax=Mytilinidion resinicola TaxID=574789 RepID=A0A6A6YVI4_9PEZI|nr:uncharacterized protein BDZ99DRAFT_243196 [Mytilinidion resinicola]KAF2812811.1 hypothetical protein BDZ99DRAFT_243196 [Mytilinidion resinicola]
MARLVDYPDSDSDTTAPSPTNSEANQAANTTGPKGLNLQRRIQRNRYESFRKRKKTVLKNAKKLYTRDNAEVLLVIRYARKCEIYESPNWRPSTLEQLVCGRLWIYTVI